MVLKELLGATRNWKLRCKPCWNLLSVFTLITGCYFLRTQTTCKTRWTFFSGYCDLWKLYVKIEIKSNALIFHKSRIIKIFFLYGDAPPKTVNEFKYFGVIMSRSESFKSTKKYLNEQASKTLLWRIQKNKIFWFTNQLSI